jgi:hypothetical protein
MALALAAASAAAVVLAPSALAAHKGPVYLEHLHTSLTDMTGLLGFSNQPMFYATNEWGNGIAAISYAPVGIGVYGIHQASSGNGPGVRGESNSVEYDASGVVGHITSISAGGASAGVRGINNASTYNGYGVVGSHTGYGVGVYGVSYGSTLGQGVWGRGHVGVYGDVWSKATDYAGYFDGNVYVNGSLSKNAGAFKIDHPLDPANRYLQHSFVESPDMKNVYDGVVTTDGRGFATVKLPSYFQALNRDFRYQLTILGTRGWRARVVSKIAGNRFAIQSDEPNVEVSWLVTGIRKDAYANAHRIQVEPPKAGDERGRYLHPELYGKRGELGIEGLVAPSARMIP